MNYAYIYIYMYICIFSYMSFQNLTNEPIMIIHDKYLIIMSMKTDNAQKISEMLDIRREPLQDNRSQTGVPTVRYIISIIQLRPNISNWVQTGAYINYIYAP